MIRLVAESAVTSRQSHQTNNPVLVRTGLALRGTTRIPPSEVEKSESWKVGSNSPTFQLFNSPGAAPRLRYLGRSPNNLAIARSSNHVYRRFRSATARPLDCFSCSLEGDLPRDAAPGDLPTAESPSLGGRAGTPPPHCFARIIARFRELSKRLQQYPATVSVDCAGGILQIRLVVALAPRALECELHGSGTAATLGESASPGALRLENLSTILRDARLRASDGAGCRRHLTRVPAALWGRRAAGEQGQTPCRRDPPVRREHEYAGILPLRPEPGIHRGPPRRDRSRGRGAVEHSGAGSTGH